MCYARRQRSSWARIKLSKKRYLKPYGIKSFFEHDLLFYFCWVVFSFRIFEFRFAHTICLYFPLCCSIFNDRFAPPLCGDLDYYITFQTACQDLFWKKLNFFQPFLKTSTALRTACLLYYFVRYLSTLFFTFLPFWLFSQLASHASCDRLLFLHITERFLFHVIDKSKFLLQPIIWRISERGRKANRKCHTLLLWLCSKIKE